MEVKKTKKLKILIAFTTVMLIGVTFVSIASAIDYSAYMSGIKSGKDYTFIIDTSTASDDTGENTITNFGKFVDTSTIVFTIYDSKGNPIVIPLDWTQIAVNPDGTGIQLKLIKQDSLPSHASALNAQADLTGTYEDDTLFASGPGFAWGRTR